MNFFNKEKKEKQNAFYSLKKTKIISKEINQLKDINFRNENEIKKFDNLIKDKNKYLFLITSYDCFMEIFSENYIKSKKDDEIIDKIYREKLKNEKLNLFGIANEILLKEKKIESLKEEINHLKNEIKENILINKNIIQNNSNENDNSSNNKKNIHNKPNNKKKVNFNLTLNNDNNNKYINEFVFKDDKCIKNDENFKLNNKKMISKEKFQKKRFSYPQIKNNNISRNNLSQIFFKNSNKCLNNLLSINKYNNDFDRTTVSSLNDKTFESENIMNNTI